MRYYFHSQDGHVFHDDEGIELDDHAAAQRAALGFMFDNMKGSDTFWETASFQVTVADREGLVLFTLDLQGRASPAARDAARTPAKPSAG